MLSMPPATITLALPAASMSCANIIARMPEPHIFDSVTAPTDCGNPAASVAWRAGAWPWPAIRQQPISTSSIASPATPARSTAALIAVALPGLQRELPSMSIEYGGENDDTDCSSCLRWVGPDKAAGKPPGDTKDVFEVTIGSVPAGVQNSVAGRTVPGTRVDSVIARKQCSNMSALSTRYQPP
jgi:hypothetical protein